MEARHARLATIHHACHIRVLLYIQVFTFMHMGGTRECMQVRMIGDASQLLTEGFNAAEAQCFKAEDRQKILAVIESSFGDIRAFNKEVRGMLDTKVIEAAGEQRGGLTTIVRTWRRRSRASKQASKPRATPQKSYAYLSTETKGDCTASSEVRPIGHTNDGSLILEEAT
jgi:hypothetical protein